jgi:ABC-type amino acid transport system permease subunit
MQSFATWTIVGAVYLAIITALSQVSRYVEKRLDYGSNTGKGQR